MQIELALVELEGTPFGLVLVAEAVLDSPSKSDQAQALYEGRIFRNLPVVLVGENFLETPRFYGRADLTEIMEGVQMDRIEWTTLEVPDRGKRGDETE